MKPVNLRQAQFRQKSGIPGWVGVFVLWFLTLYQAAGHGSEPQANAVVEKRYQAARESWLQATNSFTNTWFFARAAFDLGEVATNSTQRGIVANEAIHACRNVLARTPATNAAPIQYYLALNLGQLARTRGLSALKLVREMESLWLAARSHDASFDHAGPDRCLGLLYFDAPGWPVSLGNHAKARSHLERAVALDPDFPENRLCLAETELHWGKTAAAARLLQSLDEHWASAKSRWNGPDHALNWLEWERRRARIRTLVEKSPR